jgi:hypothetical protein
MAGKSSLRLPVPIQLIACQTREIRRKAMFESAERTKSQQKGVGADLEWLLVLRLKVVPFVDETDARNACFKTRMNRSPTGALFGLGPIGVI